MPDPEFDPILHPDAALFDAETRRLEHLLNFVQSSVKIPSGTANPDVRRALDDAMEAAFLAIRHAAMKMVPR